MLEFFWHGECNSANQTRCYCSLFSVRLLSPVVDRGPFWSAQQWSFNPTFQLFSVIQAPPFYLGWDLDKLQQIKYIDVIKFLIITHSTLPYTCFSCFFFPLYRKSYLQKDTFMFKCDYIWKFSLMCLWNSNCVVIICPDVNLCINMILSLIDLYLCMTM